MRMEPRYCLLLVLVVQREILGTLERTCLAAHVLVMHCNLATAWNRILWDQVIHPRLKYGYERLRARSCQRAARTLLSVATCVMHLRFQQPLWLPAKLVLRLLQRTKLVVQPRLHHRRRPPSSRLYRRSVVCRPARS